jgi:hypothetical protein
MLSSLLTDGDKTNTNINVVHGLSCKIHFEGTINITNKRIYRIKRNRKENIGRMSSDWTPKKKK